VAAVLEITLPMLRPSIFVALIFRTITAIQTFDIPYAMTGGGPGDSTETLAMYIHKTTLDFLDFGYGSALATLMFLLSMALTSGYLRYTRRSSGRGDWSQEGSRCRQKSHDGSNRRRSRRRERLLPGGVDPVTSLKTETELMRADHLRPQAATLANYVRVHRAADPALHVEQLRRRVAVHRLVRVRERARRVCADTAKTAASQPHHVGAARRGDVPAHLADGAVVQADARGRAAQHSRTDLAVRGAPLPVCTLVMASSSRTSAGPRGRAMIDGAARRAVQVVIPLSALAFTAAILASSTRDEFLLASR
jgi:hypothetical protein